MPSLHDHEPSPQQQPVLDYDLGSIDEDEDEDFASADASAPWFPRPSFQRTMGEANPLQIQPRVQPSSAFTPGRTPIPTRPFTVRSIPKHTTTPLTQEQTPQLLRSITQRGRSMLQTLYDYRYLTTLQIRQLFFPTFDPPNCGFSTSGSTVLSTAGRSSNPPA